MDGFIKEYYQSATWRRKLPFVTTWMDPEDTTLSEMSQPEKGKYCIFSLTCRTQERQTHRNRKQTGGYHGRTREWE